MAFVGSSALAGGGAATTTIQPTYTAVAVGNLLVAYVTGNQNAVGAFTVSGATTGWASITSAAGGATTSSRAELWWKIATAADLSAGNMPTWGTATGVMAVTIAEFSNTVFLDQSGNSGAGGTTSPVTATAGGTDKGTANLIVGVSTERQAAGTTGSFTDLVNGGSSGITVVTDNSGTSLVGHHHSIYAFVATGASADTYQSSWSFTSTHAGVCVASFFGIPPLRKYVEPMPLDAFLMDSPWDDQTTFYERNRMHRLTPGPAPQGPGGTAFDDQQDIFYPGWDLFPYRGRHIAGSVFPLPGFKPTRREPTDYLGFEPDPYDTLYSAVHRRYLEVKGQPADVKLPTPPHKTPYEVFEPDPYETWYSYPHRKAPPPAVVLVFGPTKRTPMPLDAFQMDLPWDDWASLFAHRRYLETQGKAPDPKLPLPRAKTPWDAFGFDSPWDDWVSLYAHRRYVEIKVAVPYNNGIPRGKTPQDAFGFDQPWDDWVSLFRQRRYLETKGQPADPKLPFPPHKTPLDSFAMDSPWDEWVSLYQRNPSHRFIRLPPPVTPGGTAFDDGQDIFYPPWEFFNYLHRHLPASLFPVPPPPPPPPPPPLGPPGKMERVGASSLHQPPGNQLHRTGAAALHSPAGNQLERVPTHPLHKQTQ